MNQDSNNNRSRTKADLIEALQNIRAEMTLEQNKLEQEKAHKQKRNAQKGQSQKKKNKRNKQQRQRNQPEKHATLATSQLKQQRKQLKVGTQMVEREKLEVEVLDESTGRQTIDHIDDFVSSPKNIAQAFIASEIFAPPLSRRKK